MVTDHIYVRELEKNISSYLGVKNAVGISSCTAGLMLSMQLMGLRKTEVILPSFTFVATANAAYWNDCKIVLADCDPDTFDISPEDVQEKITKETKAIIGVHIFGNPCDIKALEEIAKDNGLKLIFDSAHAFGASYDGKKVGGFGDVEVFSCSPTKLFITTEGGIVTTGDDKLARDIRVARNYGNLPDYQCQVPGLNARMTEINALVGIEMLKEMEQIVKNRNEYVSVFKKLLGKIPGIKFQQTTKGAFHAYKDFGILVDPEEFGVNRDVLYDALAKENVMTKKYFYPPVHMIDAYSDLADAELPNTEYVTNNVLCLPIHSYMDKELIEKISHSIERVHEFSGEISSKH
jgi:dTDP-4-amino-4,6-dideoxygalactose transaminase